MGLCSAFTERTPWPTTWLSHTHVTWSTSSPGLCVVDTCAFLFIRACTSHTPLLAFPTRMIIVVFPSSTSSFVHSLINKYRLSAYQVSGTGLDAADTDK